MAELITTRFLSAEIGISEGDYGYHGSFTLADVESYARCQKRDRIEFNYFGEAYVLQVENRTVKREAGSIVYSVTAISPVGFLDAPWSAETTYHYMEAVDARVAVEFVLAQSVQWELPGWTILAGRLSMAGVTPLQAAKEIVSQAGGLIESNPDGTVRCRMRDIVDVPNYASTPADHVFTDSDWITLSADDAPRHGFNRVTINNELAQSGQASDRLEVVDIDGRNKIIRAYLAFERPVALIHTGAPETVIVEQGSVTRTESQVVEFLAGKATLQFPATQLVSATWQHSSLGDIVLTGAAELSSTYIGNSLAAVKYTVKTTNWKVSLAIAEDVQFLLVDQ